MRACLLCGETNPPSGFRDAKRSYCKKCHSRRNMVRRYGITNADYEMMFKNQGHRCAICSRHEADCASAADKHTALVVDHCHSTGKVRGLLCRNCNTLLGHARDSTEVLQAAITYLRVTPH